MTTTLKSYGLLKPKLRTVETIQYEEKIKSYKRTILRLTLLALAIFSVCLIVPAIAAASRYASETITIKGAEGTPPTSYPLGQLHDNFAAFTFQMVYFVKGGFASVLQNNTLLNIDTAGPVWSKAGEIYEIIKPASIGLGAIWVMLDLIEKAQMDQLTPEVYIRWGIKIMVAIFIVQNGMELANQLAAIGNSLLQKISLSASQIKTDELTEMFNVLKTSGFIQTLTIFIEYLIPSLAMIVCSLFMLIQIFGRTIEIGVRLAFMPIGISDAFTHGINSPGMRYIKKFFAVCLQGAVLVLIMFLGVALMNDNTITESLKGFTFIADVVIAFSTLGLMMKSQQIVNDIAGV